MSHPLQRRAEVWQIADELAYALLQERGLDPDREPLLGLMVRDFFFRRLLRKEEDGVPGSGGGEAA